MVQTSEYIEDSHHQYELASLVVACGCACIYFICKVVYCNKQPFFINKHDIMVCLLNCYLYVMFRSCFESLASVVPIKPVRAAHCGVPRRALRYAASRIAAHRTYMGSCGKKMTGSFLILD